MGFKPGVEKKRGDDGSGDLACSGIGASRVNSLVLLLDASRVDSLVLLLDLQTKPYYLPY